MKVAYFVNHFPVLSQTFIIGQIAGIASRGHDVHVFADSASPDFSGVLPSELKDGGMVTYLKPHSSLIVTFFVVLRSALLGILTKKTLIFLRSLKYLPSKGVRAWTALVHQIAVINTKDFDVIHCQFATLWNVVEPLTSLGVIKGKIIVSIRGYDITSDRYIENNGYKNLFSIASVFLPVSKSLQEVLVDLGCSKNKISIHHSGIDLAKLQMKECKPFPQLIKLISVGRLVEKKGMVYGLKAVKELLGRGVAVNFSIVGDGPLRQDLDCMVRDLGLENNVNFLGSLSHDKTLENIARSDIFLMPCVTAKNGNKEGIPNVLKEAMALGVPVAATIHSGIPELIDDRVSGLLVPERGVKELVDAVIQYKEMSLKERKKIVNAARVKIEKDFDISVLVPELENIYFHQK